MAEEPHTDWLYLLADDDMSPSEVTRRVGARIRQERDRTGLSQADLARAIGVTQQAVSRWEHGEHELTLANLVAVANALDVPLATLLPVRTQDVARLRAWLDALERG